MASRWRAPAGVGLMFATNGATISSILPWYPLLKDSWGISDAVFGVLVALIGIGSLASTVVPAWAERRFGARATVLLGTVLLGLILVGFGVAPGVLAFGALLFFFGVVDTVVDVSQNVAGATAQQHRGRSVMSSLHAFWSLGSVVGGVAATWAATAGVPMPVHLSAAALVIVAVMLLAVWLVGDLAAPTTSTTPEKEEAGTHRVPGPTLATIMVLALPVAVVAGSGTIVEDVASNWAALAAVELAGVALSAAGIAYTLVLAAQTIGRFTGDLLVDRFGRVNVARIGGALILLGGLLVVTASTPIWLYAGLAMAGYGCATIVPSAYAAAAQLPGVRSSDGVTAVSWLMRVAGLISSPIIGAVSTVTHLRVGLGALVVAGALIVLLASALRRDSGKQRPSL